MKNRYIFIVSIALLTVAGSCFAAEAQINFDGVTRDSLDEQMKALKEELDVVKARIRNINRREEDAIYQVATGKGHPLAEDIPAVQSCSKEELIGLQAREKRIKSRMGMIAGQIKSLKDAALAVAASEAASAPQASAPAEEYADVASHEALPLNRAQVAAANAANRDVEVQARLRRVLNAKATVSQQLERLQTLQNRYDANSGVLPEDRLAELRMLQAQKPELERSLRGLVRSEESLTRSRVEKRPSQEALSQSHGAAATGGLSEGTRSQLRRRVEFTDSVSAVVLHREDEEAGEAQPDLTVARAAFAGRHQGSSRRNAAYVVEGVVVTPLVADGSVVAQLPESNLSELVAVPSARSERSNARRGTGFNLKDDPKSTDKSKK